MNVEIRHLRVLVAVAEELHFGRAALRLRIAQSAVSTTLRSLEEQVGATLVARTRRSVALTAAGAAYLAHARRVLEELDTASRTARRAGAGETGTLVLQFTLMATLTVVPRAVARFQREVPEVVLTTTAAGTSEQLDAIRAGRCDVGFVARKSDPELAMELVEASPLVVVMARSHPFARRRRIAWSDLARERLVFLDEATEPHVNTMFRRRCNEAGFEPDIVLRVGHLEALLAFVSAGIGVACVPALVQRVGFRDVRAVPLTPQAKGGISVVWDPASRNPAAARFLDVLRDEVRRRRA
jgi:DNA-binding transcriptional LysR family regulator